MAPTFVPVSQPVVLCGPSGAGKSTLIKKLQDEFPGQYNFSVSHTTRSPRPGEVNGKAYHFVTKAEFENLINEKGFAEYTTTYDTYYGTSLRAIKEASTEGGSCLLDIDTVGVANIKKHHASLGCLFIFISPPSLSSLGDRLRKRGTENEDTIVKRLAKAKSEIEYAAFSSSSPPWLAMTVPFFSIFLIPASSRPILKGTPRGSTIDSLSSPPSLLPVFVPLPN
ncbi:unnamed protein product [Rhizoctonia solani]|nr:unnamed protein product [Rhizoctonia solani]